MIKRYLHKIPEHHLLLVLALLVGICSGLAAVLLHTLIDLVKEFLAGSMAGKAFPYMNLVYPGVGMLLAMIFVKYVVRDNIGHGVTKVLVAVSKNDSRIKVHNIWSSIVSSAVTIGAGGSVGAEAPIVYTGAAIGSNIGRAAKMSYRNMTILLGCGAAGAVAGIFKAPLAGVLFTLEILLFNISMTSMMPLLLSTVSATVVSYIFLGSSRPFECTLTPFTMHNIPFYLLLGIFCGFMSLYFLRTTLNLEDRLGKVGNPYLKWAGCALGLGILIFLLPPLYGEGYGAVGALLNGREVEMDNTLLGFLFDYKWGVVAFFALVMFLKVFSMTFTNAGGGVGGTFGPTLFIGAMAGFVLARSINLLAGAGWSVPEQNFVLVGMAGLMAGVMQAPMTAIFLIAEISGGYELLVPLIMTAAISFGTTRLFEKYSIYTKRIAQSGDLLTHDNDQAVLTLLKIESLVKDKYPRVKATDSLRSIVGVMSNDNAAVLAVVDDEQKFLGVVDIDNIRSIMFRTDLYDKMTVSDIMESPKAYVYTDEKMDSVMDKFDRTQAWRLPVIADDNTYKGFVSRSRILSAYREELKVISQD